MYQPKLPSKSYIRMTATAVVHQRWICNGRQINVGVDVWDYVPVHEDQIRRLMNKIESGELPDELHDELPLNWNN